MIIDGGNYSFQQPDFSKGDIIKNVNLSQAIPGTEIGVGIKGLTFVDCNLVNCKLPADAKAIGCNNTQVFRCTHQHPNLIKQGVKACGEDCVHRLKEQKEWVPIPTGEQEFIALKEADAANIRITKSVDDYGITRQTFEKEVYIYEDVLQPKIQTEKIVVEEVVKG